MLGQLNVFDRPLVAGAKVQVRIVPSPEYRVPAHAHAAQAQVSKHVLTLFFIKFETGSKLDIYPYLFNHHYIPTTLRYSPLLPVSENRRVEIITSDQSHGAARLSETGRTFLTGTVLTCLIDSP